MFPPTMIAILIKGVSDVLPSFVENQYIFNIDYDKPSQKWFQYIVHQPHEHTRCIC